MEAIRAFLILAWELKAISRHALADPNARQAELGKQATGWQQWFEQSTGNARAGQQSIIATSAQKSRR